MLSKIQQKYDTKLLGVINDNVNSKLMCVSSTDVGVVGGVCVAKLKYQQYVTGSTQNTKPHNKHTGSL